MQSTVQKNKTEQQQQQQIKTANEGKRTPQKFYVDSGIMAKDRVHMYSTEQSIGQVYSEAMQMTETQGDAELV